MLDFIVLGLATYRLASLFSEERGPYRIFCRLRVWAGEYYNAEQQRSATTEFGRGLICLHCCSIWFGALLAVGYYFWPGIVWLCLPLALSAVAMLAANYVNS